MPGCVGRWRARGRRAWRYAVHERNPITQALYVALVCGGVGAALLDGRNEVTRGEAAALLASAAAAMFSFVSVSRADPGRVTAANHAERVRRYACDELIFYSGAECRTCRLEKPARSKHCRFCGVCVARYDHHCVWINSCVGEGNAALFLLFLAATLVLLAVAAAVVFGALLRYVARERLMEARFRAPDGSVMPATRWMVFMYVNHHRQALALVAALVALMLPVVGAFFAQHVFLAATNATTNERAKRAALAKITADDLHAHLCEEADAAGRPHPPRDPVRLEAERVAFCKRAARNPYSRGLLANLGEVLLRARRRG